MPGECANGHPRAADQPPSTPCAWPECSQHMGSTWTSPGVAEFPLGDALREGVIVGEIIGTFWRESTGDGWRWRLLGSRERLRPEHDEPPPGFAPGGDSQDSDPQRPGP